MNIFQQFFKSIYSTKDIAKFRFRGIGKTILYVFFLTLISVIPTTYYFTTAINNALELSKETLKKDIPPFVIENGQLSTDSKSPIIIEKSGINMIVDSTGTIDLNEIERNENSIALLKEEFVFMAGGQPQTYSYAMFADMKLSNQDILVFLQSLDQSKIIFLPILILIIYIFSSGTKFIEVSILALIGLFIASLMKKNTPYRQLWRMAAYSVTLPTVFFTIMAWIQTTVPNGFLINWFVAILILTLAVKEIPSKRVE